MSIIATQKTTTWRDLKRVAFLDLTILVVCLVILEVGFRILQPSWAVKPTNEHLTFGHSVLKNAQGFRGDEFFLEKPDGKFRVLVFGNSVTFGTGAAQEEIFTARLGDHFRRNHPDRDVEIVNMAVQGGSVPVFQQYLDKYGKTLAADLVVFAFNSAMIAQTARAGTTKNVSRIGLMANAKRLPLEIHKLLFSSYSYRTFDALFRKNLYRFLVLKEDLSTPTGYGYAFAFDAPNVDISKIQADYRSFENHLSRFADTVARLGSEIMIVNIPERFTISADARDNFRHYPLSKIRLNPATWIHDIAKRHQFKFCDVRPALVEARTQMLAGHRLYDPLYISNDHNHLNALGHDIVSRRIAKELAVIISAHRTER